MKSQTSLISTLLISATLAAPVFAASGKTDLKSGPATTAQGTPVAQLTQTPGQISGLSADHTTVKVGDPVVFTVQGSGHCKLHLNFGDGYGADQEGDLPMATAPAKYSTTTMLSYESFKNYTAQASPEGACKILPGKSASVVITVNNPNVQGVPAGSKPALVVLPQGATLPCVKVSKPGVNDDGCKN